MQKFEDVVVHQDSPDLTYHESVTIPNIVPVTVNFSPDVRVGRATLRRSQHQILANIYLDLPIPDLADASFSMLATNGTQIFTAETDGVTYAMEGEATEVSVLTNDGVKRMAAEMAADILSELEEEEEVTEVRDAS